MPCSQLQIIIMTTEKEKENHSQQSSLEPENPSVPSTEMAFPVQNAAEILCIKNTKD